MKSKAKLPTTRHLLISNMSNCLGFGMFVPLLAAYIIHLGQQPAQASFIWSVYTLTLAILLLVLMAFN